MKRQRQKQLIHQYGATQLITLLEPYITEQRKKGIDNVIQTRLKDIHLAIESPLDINNALAAVRSSEAFGIAAVHIITPIGDAKYIRSITQGTFYWIDIFFYESLHSFLYEMKNAHFILAGGMMSAEKTISEIPTDQFLCVLLGNEQQGLSPHAIHACDLLYRIPMYGMAESLNLSVSAGISLYDVTKRKRECLQKKGNLNSVESEYLCVHYYLNSVQPRLVQHLFKQLNPVQNNINSY